MRRIVFFYVVTVMLTIQSLSAQEVYLDNASDPMSMKSHASVDVESYIYHNEAQFFSLRPGYFYGLKNERHLLGMSLPIVHNIFKGDYAGFENTTGVGDLRISYLFVPYRKKNSTGIERLTLAFDVTVPTGEYKLGRGAGAWLYKPAIVFTYRPGPSLAFYPEVRFQFSGSDVNSEAGTDGAPDPEDPEKDNSLQNLSLAIPMVAQLEDWDGWFGIHILYTRSLVEKTDFVFLRSDFGKMISERTAASLRITKFIAGQPRLNVVVQANFSFFLQ